AYPPIMWEYPNRPEPEYPYAASIKWAFGFVLSQADQIFFLQKPQLPHAIVNGTTTRSPRRRFVTRCPVSSTVPMNSCPRMSPSSIVGMKPSYKCKSDPQMAVRVILTMASCGLKIVGSLTL